VSTLFIKEENWSQVIINFDCSVIIWDMWNTSYVMLCYNITINTMFAHYDTPFQYSVFRKVPMQNLFNFVHHIMTPNFEDDEL